MDNNSSQKDGNKDPVFYRNKEDLISRLGIEVEAGSLWELKPGSSVLELVDDDQYATYPLDENLFEPEN